MGRNPAISEGSLRNYILIWILVIKICNIEGISSNSPFYKRCTPGKKGKKERDGDSEEG